jgi:hypothetical protein
MAARRMEGMAARRPEARRGMAAAGTSLSAAMGHMGFCAGREGRLMEIDGD